MILRWQRLSFPKKVLYNISFSENKFLSQQTVQTLMKCLTVQHSIPLGKCYEACNKLSFFPTKINKKKRFSYIPSASLSGSDPEIFLRRRGSKPKILMFFGPIHITEGVQFVYSEDKLNYPGGGGSKFLQSRGSPNPLSHPLDPPMLPNIFFVPCTYQKSPPTPTQDTELLL